MSHNLRETSERGVVTQQGLQGDQTSRFASTSSMSSLVLHLDDSSQGVVEMFIRRVLWPALKHRNQWAKEFLLLRASSSLEREERKEEVVLRTVGVLEHPLPVWLIPPQKDETVQPKHGRHQCLLVTHGGVFMFEMTAREVAVKNGHVEFAEPLLGQRFGWSGVLLPIRTSASDRRHRSSTGPPLDTTRVGNIQSCKCRRSPGASPGGATTTKASEDTLNMVSAETAMTCNARSTGNRTRCGCALGSVSRRHT